MPHTYIIIFCVILFAAILTMFIPLGKYETKEITYTMNGEEKTRTVLDPDSFEYVLDENGNKVTKVAAYGKRQPCSYRHQNLRRSYRQCWNPPGKAEW